MDEHIPAVPATAQPCLRLWCHRISGILIMAGCVMQGTVRDRFPFPLAMFYYGLPRPVLLALALLAAMTSTRTAIRCFWLCAAGLFAAGVWWGDVENHAPATDGEPGHTVAFWNVGRNLPHDVVVVDGFLDAAPELVGLVETGNLSPEWVNNWKKRRPDYEFVTLPNNCLLVVRGTVLGQGEIRMPEGSFASWADVRLAETAVRAVMVDIAANVWISRKEPILKLAAALNSWNDKPIIVLGDFNTPDESVWLEEFRPRFREVFRTAGSGYAPTWPWPCPVLKLDQIWISRDMELRRAWRTSSWRSDHRVVWAEVRWGNEE